MTIQARHPVTVRLPQGGRLRVVQGRRFSGGFAESLLGDYPGAFFVVETDPPPPPSFMLLPKGGGYYEIIDQAGTVRGQTRGRKRAEDLLETLTNRP
jgi:hypothetical protein